jgi:hypothetical protein
MGHVASQNAPLVPDLEEENELVTLIPFLMDNIFSNEPEAQSECLYFDWTIVC